MRFHVYSSAEQRLAERRRRRWQQMNGVDGDVRGFGPITYGDPSLVGGVLTAEADTSDKIKWSAIATGVLTGVGIWFATAMLDRLFPKLKR